MTQATVPATPTISRLSPSEQFEFWWSSSLNWIDDHWLQIGIAVGAGLLIYFVLSFLLNFLLPLYGLAYAQCITEVILAAAAVVMLIRIFRQDQK